MEQLTKIRVEAVVNAPIAKVWEAWTTPGDIMQWSTPDPSWHTTSSENDLIAGGKFNNRMEAKDGSFGFDFSGIYDRIVMHQEITYTLDDGRQATTLFNEINGRTHLATTFDPETQNDPAFQKQGWQAILDNFVTYVESNKL
ncbi:MAG: ATPase [Sphingobacteriaceae bacterium]|nr:MAG: ATPase [Sphingobacteriaceae bacterium]